MYKVLHRPRAVEHLPTTHPHAGATSHAMLSVLALPIDTACLVPVPVAAQPGKRNGVGSSSVLTPTVACGRGLILPKRQKGRRAGAVNSDSCKE